MGDAMSTEQVPQTKRRGRPRKATASTSTESAASTSRQQTAITNAEQNGNVEPQKRGRGRPRKTTASSEGSNEQLANGDGNGNVKSSRTTKRKAYTNVPDEEAPRKRGRPRKDAKEDTKSKATTPSSKDADIGTTRGRGRPPTKAATSKTATGKNTAKKSTTTKAKPGPKSKREAAKPKTKTQLKREEASRAELHRQIEAMQMRSKLLDFDETDGIDDSFPANQAIGQYKLRALEIEDQWPNLSKDMKMAIFTNKAVQGKGLIAGFQLGIVEGTMLLCGKVESVQKLRNQITKVDPLIEVKKPTLYNEQEEYEPREGRLFVKWRGRDTGEGDLMTDIHGESNNGWIDFSFPEDGKITIAGRIDDVMGLGGALVFTGEKFKDTGGRRPLSWNSLSEDALMAQSNVIYF